MANRLILSFLIWISGGSLSWAQDASYTDLKSLVQTYVPDLPAENRLVALQIWSVQSPASREQNKELDHTFHTYAYARLKGGSKGLVAISICLDNTTGAAIVLKKDGVTYLKSVDIQDVQHLMSLGNLAAGYNVVFDASGAKLYESLPAKQWFSSIHQLITR